MNLKKRLLNFYFKLANLIMLDKYISIIIIIYAVSMLTVIGWGIPSPSRPFTYNMDEWHQLASVKALFSQGTPNVPGAAHGSIFQFLLSGIYLILFTVFGIVNPFAIHSLMDNLTMQGTLFVVMRSNTLLFGILSIITLTVIAKKYLKSNAVLTAILFVGTPIFLTLSNFFKYDVALIFWICFSILFIMRYAKSPNLKNFTIAAIPCALSFATKVSAIPMLAVYVLGYFWFTPNWKNKYKYLIIGVSVFMAIFIIFGIPDIFFRWSDYMEYFSSNLTTSVNVDKNYLLGISNKWLYLFFVIFPLTFGHIFYMIFFLAFVYWLWQTIGWFYGKKNYNQKNEIFILLSLVLFLLSLIPLGLGASGNRLLVLLPFLVLLSAKFVVTILKFGGYKIPLIIFIGVLIALQIRESSIVIYAKYSKNVIRESSGWIVENIPKGEVIGLENIPIYQTLPDIVLKEYYLNLTTKNAKTRYSYRVINNMSDKLPKIIIITNRYVDEKYLIKSSKKDLLMRMKKENYKIIAEFLPNKVLYKLFGNHRDYYLSGLNFILPVTIYDRG